MTHLANFKYGFGNISSSTLCVMALSNNPIKKFATFAEFHDEVNGISVLISLLEGHNVGVSRQVPHDLYLSFHIFHVNLRSQLRLRYLLARKRFATHQIHNAVSHAELTTTQLLPELVLIEYVPWTRVRNHIQRTRRHARPRRHHARPPRRLFWHVPVAVGSWRRGLARVLDPFACPHALR
ncbi:hypothetical protein V8G54_024059 [Vigna mungo]|uniref:Uncharacterized protein n=1 Tax=Vigna mungo TaxID=3915 RepID=A0AAQ3N6M3_VIGMU